ncbi:MAG: AmmeMemoRadiSam system protein B [Pseudomonadota bacterium]
MSAIAAERPTFDVPTGVTGITVPHHLLAADLIARGFWAASRGDYDRIVILSPDHFRLVPSGFAVDASDHETPLGPILGDKDAERVLEQAGLAFHPSIASEHGVGALLPFIAHFLPDTPVVSAVLSVQSTAEDWSRLEDILQGLVGPKTLVVQSTDYSHFLPMERALVADMQTLAVIASQGSELIKTLIQPDHMDALGAQFIQMRLQQKRFEASEAVIGHRLSTEYGAPADNVTSYIVTVYHQDAQDLSGFDYPDQSRIIFGGDVLTGRYMGPVLADANAQAAILNSLTELRNGAPLVINLEGVITQSPVGNAPAGAHLMSSVIAPDFLKSAGVVAAGLANNHAHDFGTEAAQMTSDILEQAGIKSLLPGKPVDLGPVRVVALNALPGRDPWVEDFTDLCELRAEAPLIVFAHWGQEYENRASPAEAQLADQAANCGISAVIGAHSHVASTTIELSPKGAPFVFSLGNLLFDQTSARSSGALAELRVFKHGSIALRLIPIPNLFELGREAMSR